MAVNTAIFLISFDDFIGRVPVSEEMDSNELTPFIDTVQRAYLPKLICPALYQEIITEKLQGYFTPANETLVDDYIKDYLVHKTWSKFVLHTNFKHTPSGFVVFRGDEWGESIDDKGRAELIQDSRSTALYFEQSMVGFLDSNADDYPNFKTCQCKSARSFSQQIRITSVDGNGRTTRTEKRNEGANIERIQGAEETPD